MYRLIARPQRDASSSSPETNSPPQSWKFQNPYKTHTKKIVLACSLVFVPMGAFTITILCIVFSRRLNLEHCPHPELCPDLKAMNSLEGSNYYVDFSVGRLAFASSLSSTISFALVAALMTMYGFIAARQFLEASTSSEEHSNCPSPYNTSILVRLLNAEMFMLWDICKRKIYTALKRRKDRTRQNGHIPPIIRTALFVFTLSLLASMFIQIADTYLHVVIEAISATRLFSEQPLEFQYSRRLAPWCYDAGDTIGTNGSKLFWGCGIDFVPGKYVRPANSTLLRDISGDINSYTMNFTDANGVNFALQRPAVVDPQVDWSGEGFGVSTQCTAIPRTACKLSDISGPDMEIADIGFNCSEPLEAYGGKTISGNFTASLHEYWYEDFHQFLKEKAPFINVYGDIDYGNLNVAKNMTREDAASVFRNPWHWLTSISITASAAEDPPAFRDSALVWRDPRGYSSFFLYCNTTVWDTSFAVVNSEVVDLSYVKSNSSITGITSMVNLKTFNFVGNLVNQAYSETSRNRTTPAAYITQYEKVMSKMYLTPLVAHTVPAPAHLVQRRVTNVITKLPMLSLWLLVTANMLFALLGLVLACIAFKATSIEVHQVHTRLTTAGLAAQLFEWEHARRAAKDDSQLFKENLAEEKGNSTRKIVSVKCTATGGAEYVVENTLVATLEDEEQARPLQPRRTL